MSDQPKSDYPQWKYKDGEQSKLVNNVLEEKQLGDGWKNYPPGHSALDNPGKAPKRAAPAITSVSPNPVTPGAQVSVVGTGFGAQQGKSTVEIDGVAVPTVTAWTDTSISFQAPSSITAGSVVVVVDGQSSSKGQADAEAKAKADAKVVKADADARAKEKADAEKAAAKK